MTSTRQGKKGSTKIATIVVLSLLLALSPFVGGCPGEPDPIEVEPIEVMPDPIEVEPIEVVPDPVEVEPIEVVPDPIEVEPIEVVPDPIEVEPITEPIIVKPTPGPTDIVAEADFEAIDQHALAIPESAANTAESLAAWLVEPAGNDLEKVRAIYRWIAQNIYYDVVSSFNIIEGTGPVGDQSPQGVLDSRKAVCAGYSRLFKALAHLVGLEVVQVTGWAKGFGYTVEGLTEEPNHAWNAVKINDGWYLMDSTWGAGSRDEEGQFVRKFKEFYFLTPPDQFIYRHFPVNREWQLLEVPVTKDEFAKLPLVRRGFFENQLEFVSHPEGVIEVEHSVVVTISAPEDVQLSAEVEQDGQRLPRLTFVQREGEYYVIEAVFPGPGDYSLIIFAGKRGEAEELESVIEYTVKVSKGLPGPIGFPETYRDFREEAAYLYTPKAGYLQSGSIQLFKLRVPRAESVAVIVGNEWHHLVKRGALFEGRVPIVAGEIAVIAKFPDREHYWRLLSYTGL